METNNRLFLVTGAFGFIGSNMVRFLNSKGITPIVYDTAQLNSEQWRNLSGLNFKITVDPLEDEVNYDFVIHLGANSSTPTSMSQALWESNFLFSQKLFLRKRKAKFIYASSAATYGAEEKDFTERLDGLTPTNAYGFLKLQFDKWIFGVNAPYSNRIGLRFFNVYGPNEGFKGAMASVVHKALNKREPIYQGYTDFQNRTPTWSLFKSDKPIQRDFIFVDDICNIIWFFITNNCESGIYNAGSGQARSFEELVGVVDSTFEIQYVDIPASIKSHYQYFTQANLTKLRAAGYDKEFTSLEDGIKKTREALGL